MRYEDWDVLLFPGPEAEQPQIPLKEFRTTCVAVRDRVLERCATTRLNSIGPLMHCFVPSLAENAPFQISVHAWSNKHFHYHQQPESRDRLTQSWQVKVFINGEVVSSDVFSSDAWPRVVPDVTKSEDARQPAQLLFPKFNQEVMQQRSWAAHDNVGRIKVMIAEGYVSLRNGEQMFTKLINHAIFNFQPAPMEVLQNAGIAWPNAHIYRSALYMDVPVADPAGPSHSRNASNSSIKTSPMIGLPGAPPPTPNMDSVETSRSTSAYSTIPFSALPLGSQPPTYPDMDDSKPVEVRLPSDQFARLINALKPNAMDTTLMPPPPLPAPQQSNKATKEEDRRSAVASDISMHTDCQSYPDCTSMDEHGHVVHVPAHSIRSRKEGSTDLSNRDFLSNILNPTSPQSGHESTPAKQRSLLSSSPASVEQTRKRTRASLKAWTVNDAGSPEKIDNQVEEDDDKPARKVSMASRFGKENIPTDDEMVVDA